MRVSDTKLLQGRSRLSQVFHYMDALNNLRNPVVRRVDEHSPQWLLWLRDLPEHPCAVAAQMSDGNEDAENTNGNHSDIVELDGMILRVQRPKLSEAPSPPDSLEAWVQSTWQHPDGSVVVQDVLEYVGADGSTTVADFTSDPQRVEDFNSWSERWEIWAASERPARRVNQVFESLYSLYGMIQREADRVELVLGDGILGWWRPEASIYHPVILMV